MVAAKHFEIARLIPGIQHNFAQEIPPDNPIELPPGQPAPEIPPGEPLEEPERPPELPRKPPIEVPPTPADTSRHFSDAAHQRHLGLYDKQI